MGEGYQIEFTMDQVRSREGVLEPTGSLPRDAHDIHSFPRTKRSDELGVNRVLLGTLGVRVSSDDPEGSKRLHADVRTVARPRQPNW